MAGSLPRFFFLKLPKINCILLQDNEISLEERHIFLWLLHPEHERTFYFKSPLKVFVCLYFAFFTVNALTSQSQQRP